MLVPKAAIRECRYGGLQQARRKATGYFRVEKISDRWWLVDPGGLPLLFRRRERRGREPPHTPIIGRVKLFASIPTFAQSPRRGADPQTRCAIPCRSTWPICSSASVKTGVRPSAQLTARRMRAWGLNTAYGAALNDALPPGPPLRQPYVYPAARLAAESKAPSWACPMCIPMRSPARVELEAAQQLDGAQDRPLDDRLLHRQRAAMAGARKPARRPGARRADKRDPAALQGRARAGDTPAIRKALVHAAFTRYLEIVNAAVRRHDPNHLNLGIRFGGTPPDEVIALARGFDVYSMNKYRWAPPKDFIDRVYAIKTSHPDRRISFRRARARPRARARADDEPGRTRRGVFVLRGARGRTSGHRGHSLVPVDRPARDGRRDGENYNIGWIDVTDRPYPELVAAAKATHAKLDDIHSGRLAATTRSRRLPSSGRPRIPSSSGCRRSSSPMTIVRRAALFLFCGALLYGRPTLADIEIPPIGTIDFYGMRSLSESEVRQHLPFKEGDGAIRDHHRRYRTTRSRAHSAPRKWSSPSCAAPDGGRTLVYVGVQEHEAPGTRYNVSPTGKARLPADILAANDRYTNAQSRKPFGPARPAKTIRWDTRCLLRAGSRPAGTFPGVRKDHKPLLLDVLRKLIGRRSARRSRVSARLLPDKKSIVKPLTRADVGLQWGCIVTMPCAALGVIASYSIAHPELRIRIDPAPFVHMLNSIVWSDRNKGLWILDSLTAARDPRLLKSLRKEAGSSLVEMCAWKDWGHAFPACQILRRVMGMPDDADPLSRQAALERARSMQ